MFLVVVVGVSVVVVLIWFIVGDVFVSILVFVLIGWGFFFVSIFFCVCVLRIYMRFVLEIVCSLVINGNGNIIYKVIWCFGFLFNVCRLLFYCV